MIATVILLSVVPAAGTAIWAYRRACRWVDAAAAEVGDDRAECSGGCAA